MNESEFIQLAEQALADIQEAIDTIRNPEGTQEAPARTCKDLSLAHPEFESGKFVTQHF